MSQYILTARNEEKADALIQFLLSLDYIEIQPLDEQKQRAIETAKDFLSQLPERSYNRLVATL